MITPQKTRNVKVIRPYDVNYSFTDGISVYRRAALEITDACPDYYKQIILEAHQKGWIVPVVQMPENEFILMGLSN